MSWDPKADRDFWRQKCYDSFWWFFRYAYGYEFNPKGAGGKKPWLREETHKAACDWFERHALEWLNWRSQGLGRPKKLIVVVPRDWGKTTLFAQAGQLWLHLHDNELATYSGSESLPRTKEMLNGIKAVISGDDKYARFAHLYGSWYDKDRTWKMEEVVTSVRTNLTRRDASFGTWAVNTGLTGCHPDGCFFDDPNTYERMERDEDWLYVVNRHFDTLIPVFQSDAIWCLTATRYGSGDHVGRTLDVEGCASMTGMAMPDVEVRPDGQWHVLFMDAIDEATDTLTMPQIWSRERMASLERRNPERFWAQVRNNPTRSISNPLTFIEAHRLVVTPESVDTKKLFVTIHLDTAFKRPERAGLGDTNVIEIWGHDRKGSGMVTRLDCRFSNEWDSETFAKNLVEVVSEWRPKCARIVCMTDDRDAARTGATRALFTNAFAKAGVQMPQLLELTRSTNKNAKPRRLAAAAALWKQGKVRLVSTSPGLGADRPTRDTLVEQMTQIGKSRHDDFADAASDVFHEDVYQAMSHLGAAVAADIRANPFDDILKPGPSQIIAANTLVDRTLAQESQFAEHFDVVQPV